MPADLRVGVGGGTVGVDVGGSGVLVGGTGVSVGGADQLGMQLPQVLVEFDPHAGTVPSGMSSSSTHVWLSQSRSSLSYGELTVPMLDLLQTLLAAPTTGRLCFWHRGVRTPVAIQCP